MVLSRRDMIFWLSLTVLLLLFVIPHLLTPRWHWGAEVTPFMRFLWWVNRAFTCLFHNLRTERSTQIPVEGPAILISNHTCGIDHTLLQAGTRRALGFVIAQYWFDHPSVSWLCRILKCIPVKRDGRDVSAIRGALRALDEGRVLPIFPEGRIVPTSGRQLAGPQSGAAYIALRSRVPVIPAYISGTPPTEDVFRAARSFSNARVVYGEPIDLSDLVGETDRESLERAAERMIAGIRKLRDRVHPEWSDAPTYDEPIPDEAPRPNRHARRERRAPVA
jgi:1-acyl-sn-glycerol-3-phosphate acyltransferase